MYEDPAEPSPAQVNAAIRSAGSEDLSKSQNNGTLHITADIAQAGGPNASLPAANNGSRSTDNPAGEGGGQNRVHTRSNWPPAPQNASEDPQHHPGMSRLLDNSIFGTPSPPNFDVTTISRQKPKAVLRIERDYTGGELCQFWSGFLWELEARVSPSDTAFPNCALTS